ncbi:hypothetical protein OU995_16240 [Roseateles sp. SL47]|uniref:hypothetical protein n=1 Tax=Roseateles sp. SL47 TaxID=2995138 RepID=UPI00226E4FEB|nr:hypothetical protein [Roseateles sp. SL47]WAC71145.1 hypothetical protein OU995_16240 [Roseateles sp. SL47]
MEFQGNSTGSGVFLNDSCRQILLIAPTPEAPQNNRRSEGQQHGQHGGQLDDQGDRQGD